MAKSRPKAASDEENRLLQAVYDDPDDDGPRSVYADFLQQRGDPHGELIALQLQPSPTPKQRDRSNKILKDKAALARRLGPLAPIVKEPVFERGFLHACRLVVTEKRRALLAHPAWSTVREISTTELAAIESPAMRSLRAATGLGVEHVVELARRKKPLGLEALRVAYAPLEDVDDGELWREVCEIGALAKLRELELVVDLFDERGSEPEAYKWLLDSKLGRQLEVFELDHPDASETAVHAWFREMGERTTLRRFALRQNGGRGHRWRSTPIAFTRTANQLSISVTFGRVSIAGKLGTEVLGLTKLLDGFPDRDAPEITVRIDDDATPAYVELVKKQLAKPLAKRFSRVVFEYR